jgi:hypothetical protein
MTAPARKRSKYNVDRSALGKLRRTLDGVVYDSAAERDYAAELEHAKRLGIIADVLRQVRFSLFAWSPDTEYGTVVCDHIVDFVVVNNDGTKEIREVKGVATDSWRIKRKLFEQNYPRIPYVVIKQKRNVRPKGVAV